jgi:uncharacterized phage protein (TIGR01671 family)
MNKEFRAYDTENKYFVDPSQYFIELDGSIWFNLGDDEGGDNLIDQSFKLEIMQWTGLYDRNGVKIFESDALRFADKWEWYRASGATKEETGKLPYEQREIIMPECYEWLLSSEIQTYWEVAGNIYENPELLKEAE